MSEGLVLSQLNKELTQLQWNTDADLPQKRKHMEKPAKSKELVYLL